MVNCALPQQSRVVGIEILCPAKSKIFTFWTFTKKVFPALSQVVIRWEDSFYNSPSSFWLHILVKKCDSWYFKAKGSEVLTKVWKAMIYVEKYSLLNPTLLCRVSVPIFKKRFNMNFIFISMRLCHLLVVVFSTTLSVPAIVLILVIYGLCERQNVSIRWKTFFS